MIYKTSSGRGGGFGGLAGGAPPPQDLVAILGVLFTTFSLQFFAGTAIIPALLRLSPEIFRGFVWQIVTYPFVGAATSGLWFLFELLILFWFGRDVYWRLGRQRFWHLILRGAVGAALVAVAIQFVFALTGFGIDGYGAFQLMQGQRILIAIFIAAFATLWGNATILLFFVLPIRARWFLWLEVLFAFIGFLESHDFAGFCGVCTAVFLTYSGLQPGGPRRVLRDWRKRAERIVLERRLERLKRKRRFDVIDGGADKDRWLH
ncbi:MAG: hypothetical protein ACC742_08210 [Thermoanaerobaculales bacterium]